MGGRSGERARRLALGIVPGRNGAEAATLRYSVNDRPSRPLPPILAGKPSTASAPVSARKDAAQLRAALQRELARANRDVEAAKASLYAAPRDPLEITDHAVIRFLERVMGVNINAIRAQISRIIPPDALELDRAIYVRDRIAYIVQGRALITVLDESLDELGIAYSIDGVTPMPERPSDGELQKNVRRAARLLSRRAHEPARQAKAKMTRDLMALRAAGWPELGGSR